MTIFILPSFIRQNGGLPNFKGSRKKAPLLHGGGMVLEDHVKLKMLLWTPRATQLALTVSLKLFRFSLAISSRPFQPLSTPTSAKAAFLRLYYSSSLLPSISICIRHLSLHSKPSPNIVAQSTNNTHFSHESLS